MGRKTESDGEALCRHGEMISSKRYRVGLGGAPGITRGLDPHLNGTVIHHAGYFLNNFA